MTRIFRNVLFFICFEFVLNLNFLWISIWSCPIKIQKKITFCLLAIVLWIIDFFYIIIKSYLDIPAVVILLMKHPIKVSVFTYKRQYVLFTRCQLYMYTYIYWFSKNGIIKKLQSFSCNNALLSFCRVSTLPPLFLQYSLYSVL